ncbi:TLCD1 protein, partial [Atractosteus spatula]|nr:TLCD1 protein [Atractosteus spatula]
MEDSLAFPQKYPTLSVVLLSVAFRAVHRLLRVVPLPKTVEVDRFKTWKWRNLCVSLVHSLLTGPWAVTCVVWWPELLYKLHSFYTPVTYLLICVSTGYFIQDAGDIILSGQARASWEFLLHHALVIWCFLYALYTRMYVAGTVVALFVEVNSVFLHSRLLFKLAAAHSSPLYGVIKLLNLLTYVSFRLGAQFYLTWYILRHYATLEHAGYFLSSLLLMNGMMLVYFYRLLRADIFPQARRCADQNGTAKSHSGKFVYD